MKKLSLFFALLCVSVMGVRAEVAGSSQEHCDGNAFVSAYDYSFSTSGTNVTLSFTNNDNVSGLVAILWYFNPGLTEMGMTVSGKTASITLPNQTPGSTIEFACKFAFAADTDHPQGMSVTKHFTYTVEGSGGGDQEQESDSWADVAWLPNSNQYKVVVTPEIPSQYGGMKKEGDNLWIGFPSAAFGDMSISPNGGDGAWKTFALANFPLVENQFTVVCQNTTYKFDVFNKDGKLQSEYCGYEGEELQRDGHYIKLTIETDESGNVNIKLAGGTNAGVCSYRNRGFEGGIGAFVVSTDDFVTTTPASTYFTSVDVYSGNVYTLTKIADVPAGAKIKHIGAGHALAWKDGNEDRWCFPDIIYTYGGVCAEEPVLTEIQLTASAKFGLVNDNITLTAIALDQMGAEMDEPITFEVSPAAAGSITGNVFTFAQSGAATITARSGEVYSSVNVYGVISDNIAKDKTCEAGYYDNNPSETAAKVNDGDDNTAWVTYANRPAAEEWWYVDLGSVYDLSAIAVLWGDDYSSEYILQVRTDAPADEDKANDEAWTNIVPSAITTATANGTVFSEVTAQGRYVRLHSLARSTFNCIRLKEVRIFGVEHVDAGVLVESITLDQTEKTIEMYEPLTLTAEVLPSNAADKSITWSSDNTDVATVENGVITTVAPGTANITATANDGSNVSATCELTVTAIEAKTCWGVGNDFTFQENPVSYYYSITRNADRTLTVHVEFSRDIQGLGNLNVVWGDAWHLMPYDQSTKTATYTTEEKYNLNTILSGPFFYFEGRRTDFSYTVGSVCAKPSVAVEGVMISHTTLPLIVDEQAVLTAEVIPANSDDKEIIWTNSNPTVASFDEATGTVTALAVGTTTITAKSHADATKTASCEVTVTTLLDPVTYWGNGKDAGNDVAIAYSITRNADRTLTYTVEVMHNRTDLVVQVNDGGWHGNASYSEGVYTWTSEATYIDGNALNGFFYMPYGGENPGAARVDFSYTIGAESARKYIPVTLQDDGNSAVIAASDEKLREVTLNRTFPNTEEWYTLCLPFDLSEEQMTEIFGAGYTLATLQSSEDRGSLIHLNFDFVDAFEAGKAYLLRPGEAVTANPVFNGVTIKNVNPADQAATSTYMNFQGTFDKIVLNNENQRFVGPENYLYSPAANGTNMKAFRCYFTIPAQSPISNAPGRAARIFFSPQIATGMENVAADTMQSQKVLIGGQLMIIRDGRMYNAQGMLIKNNE